MGKMLNVSRGCDRNMWQTHALRSCFVVALLWMKPGFSTVPNDYSRNSARRFLRDRCVAGEAARGNFDNRCARRPAHNSAPSSAQRERGVSVVTWKCGRGGGRHRSWRVALLVRVARGVVPAASAAGNIGDNLVTPRSRFAERGAGLCSAPSRATGPGSSRVSEPEAASCRATGCDGWHQSVLPDAGREKRRSGP